LLSSGKLKQGSGRGVEPVVDVTEFVWEGFSVVVVAASVVSGPVVVVVGVVVVVVDDGNDGPIL
jgi:hypothetical protein